MELIVVGVDSTPASKRAVRWSAELAKSAGARVLAVHVVPSVLEWELAAVQVNSDPLIRQRREKLKGDWTKGLRTMRVPYSTRFVRGDPAKKLLQIAEKEHADLIVIGAKSHGRVHQALMGGTAHELANRAGRPVALIPARQTLEPELKQPARRPAGGRAAHRVGH